MSTGVVFAGLIAAALTWEAWTLINRKKGDTISEAVWRAVYKRPFLAFLAGLLMGHFFWLPSECWEIVAK